MHGIIPILHLNLPGSASVRPYYLNFHFCIISSFDAKEFLMQKNF